MKRLFILIMVACTAMSSFAQTKKISKTEIKKTNAEVVFNQQVEMLNARIDSMTIAHQQALEAVRNEQKEHYANYYNQLDSNNSMAWVILSLIWGAISVVFGIVIPLILNNKSEERVNENVKDLKDQVKSDTDDLKQQLRISLQNNAHGQNMRNKYFSNILSKQMQERIDNVNMEIDEQKKYAHAIKTEVEEYVKSSKINSLLSSAQNIEKKDCSQAISIYTEILDIEPSNQEALLFRGIAYYRTQKYEDALTDLYKLIEIHPRHARAYNNIANIYADTEQIDKAKENYHKALELNPNYAAVFANLSLLYMHLNDYPTSLEYCDKALHFNDNMLKMHKHRIRLYTLLVKDEKINEKREQYLNIIKQEKQNIDRIKDKYLMDQMQ